MTGATPAPPAPPSFPPRPPVGRGPGVNVGGGSSMGRALFAFCGGLGGAYYGFYLQSKYIEERRVRCLPLLRALNISTSETHTIANAAGVRAGGE